MRNLIFAFLLLLPFSNANAYNIYPIPQSIVTEKKTITFTDKINVIFESGINQSIKDFTTQVIRDAGMIPVLSRYSQSNSYLYVGINGSGGEADQFASTTGVSRDVFSAGDNKYDPYVLQINDGKTSGAAVILGDGDGSAFYGVATLKQVLSEGKELSAVTIEDYAYTKSRGVVEGFYGVPYTVDQILSMLDFFKLYKLNTFIYGPKADPYHSGYWQEEYPSTVTAEQRKNGWLTQDDFRRITSKAKECNVNFVWAIHPGMSEGLSFESTTAMNSGIEKIMQKFDNMYNLGVRGFGVFIDDMSFTPNAVMTAYLPAQVQAKLKAKYNTSTAAAEDKVSPLFFVPTSYSLAHSSSSLNNLSGIDSDIVIAFTGANVWSNINASDCTSMKRLIGRNPLLWWNNPCNDNYDDRIYMLDMTYRFSAQTAPNLYGVAANTMQQGIASKVFLFGCADYCWNAASFNSTNNWNASFDAVIPDNETLRDAFKTFCINSEATQEPANMRTLYNNFQDAYTYNNLPTTVTNSLIEETSKIYDACTQIEGMASSENEDYLLMYKDIQPWNAKLKSMSGIIKSALEWMKSPSTIDNWITYANVLKEYGKLHKDSLFISFTLEGAGTSTSRRYFEVHPSQQYMEPFVNYLMEKYAAYSPELQQRSREPEIIHNLTTLPLSATLSATGTTVTLSGLSRIDLSTGECIGIYINNIREAIVSRIDGSFPSEFDIEYSINGKDWTILVPDGETAIEMAYVRIRNVSQGVTKAIGVETLSISVPVGGVVAPVSATTNIPQYQNNAVANVINYANDNFFWSSREQRADDYIRLDLGMQKNLYKAELLFDSNDVPTGTCVIEISSDASSWESVAEFTAADIQSKLYTCIIDKKGRYVRLRLKTASGDKWFKLIKFKIYDGKDIAVSCDNKGVYTGALDDRSLATSYTSQTEGSITYKLIENLNVEKIKIYHNSIFNAQSQLPQITMLAGGVWSNMGYLDEPLAEFDVSDYDNIEAVKIEWNSVNIPDIYDIVVSGTPYEFDKIITGVEESNKELGKRIIIEGNRLRVEGYAGDASVCNISGKVIFKGRVTEEIIIPEEEHGVFIVTINGESIKIKR